MTKACARAGNSSPGGCEDGVEPGWRAFCLRVILFRKAVPIPDQVRDRHFRDHAPNRLTLLHNPVTLPVDYAGRRAAAWRGRESLERACAQQRMARIGPQ